MSNGAWTIFLQRPVSLVLLTLSLALLALSAAGYFSRRRDWRARMAAEAGEEA
jgi:TctA family transporter